MRRTSLADKWYIKDFLNPVTHIIWHTWGAFGVRNYQHCDRSLLSWQEIDERLQAVTKSDLKCIKPRTEELFGLIVCRKYPGNLTATDLQSAGNKTMHKKNESWECTNYWSISLLDLPGKMYAIYLEKKMPRHDWTYTGGYRMEFPCWPENYRLKLHSAINF